jgi:dihydropyrimidinase
VRETALVEEQAIADVFLHPVLAQTKQEVLDDIPRLPEVGCNSIKIFMSVPWFDVQLLGYMEATRRAGENGLLTLFHCEDYAIIEHATARLMRSGRSDPRYFAESRPVVAEVVATQRAVAIAEVTGAPIYVVHLSSQRALDVCAEAQARGLPIFVETRPLYLHLTEERFNEADGPKYIGQPPLRRREDVEALWTGIREGVVHTVCSDHAPWSLAAKLDPALTVAEVRPGVENLQTMLPMLYSEGVRPGRISLQRFIEVTSTNAARLFGLYPRKGTIRVGSDADLVLFDPNARRVIEKSMLKSKADYSVYEGWEVTGWPVVTIRRGEIVFQDGEVIGVPGSGRLVRRNRAGLL